MQKSRRQHSDLGDNLQWTCIHGVHPSGASGAAQKLAVARHAFRAVRTVPSIAVLEQGHVSAEGSSEANAMPVVDYPVRRPPVAAAASASTQAARSTATRRADGCGRDIALIVVIAFVRKAIRSPYGANQLHAVPERPSRGPLGYRPWPERETADDWHCPRRRARQLKNGPSAHRE
jgi:hypothetical protein